jgi:hypothetical protein
LGGNVRRDNLEQWVEAYDLDEEEIKFGPMHLGEPVAFDMVMGKSDTKFANLVIIRNHEGEGYSIDNESACDNSDVLFVTSVQDAVNFIAEYKDDTSKERFMMGSAHTPEVNLRDNPHQHLKSNRNILRKARPIIEAAIENDITNGRIDQLYKNFVALNENDFNDIFNQFGTLIHEDERKEFIREFTYRQKITREFVEKNENKSTWFGMR